MKRLGAVYVYFTSNSGATWVLAQELLPTDGAMNDYFGWSVSGWGDRLAVGSFWDDDKGTDSGCIIKQLHFR